MKTAVGQGATFDGIQYLRAIAALMVVVHHARHYYGEVPGWTDFGSRGVDIFFVISGFIMVHATRAFDPVRDAGQQALDFFVRRAIRVVPLYWLALLYQNRSFFLEGNVGLGILADFLFVPRYSWTFPTQIWPTLVPGWTINYEMLFYLLFGLALLFGRRRYAALVGAIGVLVLIGGIWSFESAPLKFWTDSVLGEFALGVGVYFLFSRSQWVPGRGLLWAAMLLGIAGLAVPNQGVPRLLADGPFAAMVVWSGLYLGRFLKPRRGLSLLGDASYSIYLTHVFAFPPCYALCNALGLADPTPANIALALGLCTTVAVALGVAVHLFIEKPLLRLLQGAWRAKARRSVAVA